MFTLFTIITFFLFCYVITQIAARLSSGLVELILISFILFVGSIILTGYCLSALDLTGTPLAWAFAVFIPATIFYFISQNRLQIGSPEIHINNANQQISVLYLITSRWKISKSWFSGLSGYWKILFGTMFLTFGIIVITNLLLVLFTVPNEWDSMTGHLNRVIQYVQRGTMAHFGGTNWNIDTYPKSICTIQIYTFLMSGRVENALKFIHHLAYFVTIIAVFGTAQRIAKNLTASFFCALAFSVFLDFLMQAVTTETDIVLAAYLSCFVYFIFSYRNTQSEHFLYLSALTFGVAYGHKITFTLLLPSLFVLMCHTVFFSRWSGVNKFPKNTSYIIHRILFIKLSVAFILCFCIWTLPTGYIRNVQVFGHPIGPPTSLKHQSVERATEHGGIKNLIKQGSRNVARYAIDFANLDGFRNLETGEKINQKLRSPLVWLEKKLHLALERDTEFTIIPFTFERKFIFFNANPYWGVYGFLLIFPLVFLILFRFLRSPTHYFLAVAVLLHFISLSFSAPYDPWKGRYFQSTAIFGVLFLTLLFTHQTQIKALWLRKVLKIYLAGIVLVASLSGLMAVFLNIRCLPFDALGVESAFTVGRIETMTQYRPDITLAYNKFEAIVPDSATVALGTINDDFEYPLYGKYLSRRLIPINPFERGVQPIPKEADYLFFSKNVIKPLPTDIRLGTDTTMKQVLVPGEDYYLRKLK